MSVAPFNIDKLIDEKIVTDADLKINLGRYGFKTPDSIRVFLLSPAGATVKQELSDRIAVEDALKAQQQFNQRERDSLLARLQAAVFLMLFKKEAQAAKLKEYINELITQELSASQSKSSSAPGSSQAKQDMTTGTLSSYYTESIQQHQNQHNELIKQEAKLNQKKEHLKDQAENIEHKHPLYNESLDKLDTELDRYAAMELAELDREIIQMEQRLEQQAETLFAATDTDNVHNLLNQQNALHIQLATLHDIRSEKQQAKFYYNEQGEQVQSMKEALYIVPKEEKIVIKNGEKYLLNKDTELTEENKEAAKQRFQNKKPELLIVKESVKESMLVEKQVNQADLVSITDALSENKKQQQEITEQIRLMQLLKDNVTKNHPTPITKSQSSLALSTTPSLNPLSSPSGKPQEKEESNRSQYSHR